MTGWLKRLSTTTCLAAMCLQVPAVNGQDTLERFTLFNNCRPMLLVVEGLKDNAAEIGLTKERLQVTAESRLRSARLYTEDALAARFSRLYINVNILTSAFNVSVAYSKIVTDEFGLQGVATTWDGGGVGTHGRESNYIVSNLSESLDTFLAAYLRVNEAACAPSRSGRAESPAGP